MQENKKLKIRIPILQFFGCESYLAATYHPIDCQG